MIGLLGDIRFRVSDKRVLTIRNLKREISSSWNTMDRIGLKPLTEYAGPNLQTISFEMTLDASLGIKPRVMLQTLERMAEEFGTRPEDVQAAIGPSICQDCYEVSEDVAEAFMNEFADHQDDQLVYRKDNGKYQLNLRRANELVLLEAGIRPKYLTITNVCTCCNHELLFSHRASHGQRGNLGAFLGLK